MPQTTSSIPPTQWTWGPGKLNQRSTRVLHRVLHAVPPLRLAMEKGVQTYHGPAARARFRRFIQEPLPRG